MKDFRSPSDPALDPLLERLAFLESSNDSLKSRISAGSFDAELQNLALRDQLESSRAEVARLQETLDGLCRESLAAGQARDQAEFIAQGTVKALDAVSLDRDALRRRLEELAAELDAVRLAAQDAQRGLQEAGEKSLAEARAQSEERLRIVSAQAAEREARLAEASELERRLRESLESELDRTRRSAAEAEEAARLSKQEDLEALRAEADRRAAEQAAESARREERLSRELEEARRKSEDLSSELAVTREESQRALRALQESKDAELSRAEERQRTLAATYADREARILKKVADDHVGYADREKKLLLKIEEDRRLLALVAQMEAAAELAAARDRALRDAARKPAPPDAPLPVEGLTDPVWAKALPVLKRSVAAAFARLKQMPLSAVPEGPRAILRFAAVSLTETSDMLRALETFFDEDSSAAASGRAETGVEAALAAWEAPMRRRRISIHRRVELGLPAALVQDESVRVAVFQILRNAYDAMPRGGKLDVLMYRDPESGGVCACFSDSGPGFTDRALAGLFSPFAASRPGHLGLGLALVRRVMRRLGGDAEAQNAAPPSRGAVVILRFAPAAAPDAPAPEA